jgi:hypothetical protein
MNIERIDGISAYCDRWCERCAFTMRCSAYAVHVATAMCDGDFQEALTLAVGRPRSPGGKEEPEPEWRRKLMDMEISQAELDEISRREDEREKRLARAPLTIVASAVRTLALEWLETHRDALHKDAAPEVADALDIVSWDVFLIGGKIYRALGGHDEARHGEGHDDDPVQNDWNGSAKVALMCIRRSAAAWDVIAAATANPAARRLAVEMRDFARQVEETFPDASKFIRPGFDAQPRRKRRRA